MLEKRVKTTDSTSIDDMFKLMDLASANSAGKNWKRDDLYER